jgi:inhibitor of cysteine peptidase
MPECHIRALVLCLTAGLYCIGLSQLTIAGADRRTVTLTDQNNGETIQLKKGDLLVVRLEAQFGVGYLWQIARNRSSRLRLQGKPEQESPVRGVPDATEHQVFRFRAQAAGASTLELHYLHPWEKDVAPKKVYRISVRIN